MDASQGDTSNQEFCAACAASMAPGTGQDTYEGKVCAACHAKQQAARARKIGLFPLCALLVALIPSLVGYSTQTTKTSHSESSSTHTRVLIFDQTRSNSSSFGEVDAAEPPQFSYSDPITLPAGIVALLLSAAAAGSLLRATPRSRRGLVVVGLAALLGARAAWNGYREAADAKADPFRTDKKSYLGAWHADGVSLAISNDKSVQYKNEKTGVELTRQLRRFKGDSLVLTTSSGDTVLTVQKPPAKANGLWTMTVDGTEVSRKDEWIIKRENIERSIVAKLETQKGVASVQCPELKEVKEQKVTCKATLKNGKKADVLIELTGDNYTATYDIASLDITKFTAHMTKDIADKEGSEITLDCGSEDLFIPIGESYTCSVKVPEKHMSGNVVFVFEPESRVTWTLKVSQDADAKGVTRKRRKGAK